MQRTRRAERSVQPLPHGHMEGVSVKNLEKPPSGEKQGELRVSGTWSRISFWLLVSAVCGRAVTEPL